MKNHWSFQDCRSAWLGFVFISETLPETYKKSLLKARTSAFSAVVSVTEIAEIWESHVRNQQLYFEPSMNNKYCQYYWQNQLNRLTKCGLVSGKTMTESCGTALKDRIKTT